MAIRVLIVDDHRLFRQGLRKLLENEPGIEILGEADNGLDAQNMAHKLCPDVVLMDVKMPKINGVAATRLILKERPETGIIMLTMVDEDDQLRQALQAGAQGYLLKTADSDEVALAIRAVHKGNARLDSEVTAKLLTQFRRLSDGEKSEKGPGMLTDKEVILLQLLSKGLSNMAIARELNYSPSTVKNKVSVIFHKIGADDRIQAVVYAINHGLCSTLDITST